MLLGTPGTLAGSNLNKGCSQATFFLLLGTVLFEEDGNPACCTLQHQLLSAACRQQVPAGRASAWKHVFPCVDRLVCIQSSCSCNMTTRVRECICSTYSNVPKVV